MPNFLLRTLTGSLYVAVILASFLHSLAFLALFSLFTVALLWEFCRLTGLYKAVPIRKAIFACGGGYLFAASFAFAHGMADGTVFLPYIFFLTGILVSGLYEKAVAGDSSTVLQHWSLAFFAQVYIAGALSLLHFHEAMPFVLALFVMVWVNDSAAYLIGSRFGRHRLFERISPKKSWEGFWSGCVAVLAVSQVFACYSPVMNRYQWLGYALVIIAFATWGDLIESLLKRTLAVKDSGNILPGHGGLLDRFDSVLLAAPATYIYLRLIFN